MKRMKITLIAVMAIIMGITFTSCLNSDNSPGTSFATGMVYSGISTYFVTDNGIRLNFNNPSDLELVNSDKTTYYPKRAVIMYKEIEGEDYSPGKTNYNVSFAGYYIVFFVHDHMSSKDDVESLTPIYSIQESFEGSNYLNIAFQYYYNSDTRENDFSMYPYKWENNKLYFRLVHTKKVENGNLSTYNVYMSYNLPTKEELKTQFNDIQFTGTTNDTISIVVTAEGLSQQELSAREFKGKIRN